jgi:hypothetical protein
MATNTGKGFRRGAVKGRSQVQNPKSKDFVERDTGTGRFYQCEERWEALQGRSKGEVGSASRRPEPGIRFEEIAPRVRVTRCHSHKSRSNHRPTSK